MEKKKCLYECPASVPVEMDLELMSVVSGETELFDVSWDDFDFILW